MLQGAIIGLVVGLIGALVLMSRQSKAKAKIKADLAARNIQTVPGTGALQLRQNLLMAGGARTPEWSAMVGGQPALQVYQTGAMIVAAWTSAAGKPGTCVVTGPIGGNPDKTKLQEIGKKQLPLKGVKLFVDGGASPWAIQSAILPAFVQRFAKQPAWHLVYTEGNAYVFSYQATWAGLDDVIRTAGELERALVA